MSRHITYEDGELIQGDCLTVLAGMAEASIDLIFGSPPYELARTYREDGEDLHIAKDTEAWVAWMVEVYLASLRVCKGLVAFVVGHGTGARCWSGAPALLCAELIRHGINLRSPIWYHRQGIPGSGHSDWLRADLEWIICATKTAEKLPWSDNTVCGHPPKYPPGGPPSHRTRNDRRVNSIAHKDAKQSNAVKVQRGPQKSGERYWRTRDREGVLVPKVYTPPELANPGNVISCGALGGGKLGSAIAHDNEAPFAERLADFFVRSFCPPAGVVCDPFLGSGTTISVAIQTGRRFVGIDLRASQLRLAERRVEEGRAKKGFGI